MGVFYCVQSVSTLRSLRLSHGINAVAYFHVVGVMNPKGLRTQSTEVRTEKIVVACICLTPEFHAGTEARKLPPLQQGRRQGQQAEVPFIVTRGHEALRVPSENPSLGWSRVEHQHGTRESGLLLEER